MLEEESTWRDGKKYKVKWPREELMPGFKKEFTEMTSVVRNITLDIAHHIDKYVESVLNKNSR